MANGCGMGDEVAVSFEDIGMLRSSLEGDEIIRSNLNRGRSGVRVTYCLWNVSTSHIPTFSIDL